MLLRLPLKFWFDHMERELATPTEIRGRVIGACAGMVEVATRDSE